MRVNNLHIRNFKAIRQLDLADLADSILIAGPNGCGKSCVFDALRLLKSLYGGYNSQNEWQNFFNEFQINLQRIEEFQRVFQDPTQPVIIEATFELTDGELGWIRQTCRDELYRRLWAQHIGGEVRFAQANTAGLDISAQVNNITSIAERESQKIIAALGARYLHALARIEANYHIHIVESPVLSYAFSVYDPRHIGVIDYHSPSRTYQRERLGGINVSIEDSSQRSAQHALYNWQGKYANVKSELATGYIRDLLIKQTGEDSELSTSVISTIQELFKQFLPEKIFLGPRPGPQGELSFPVQLPDGTEHDIDDLSSGEKELVYGYLRLRNASPAHSIILLDEPELHLNPRLISGLPSFYRAHLGEDLGNQLWMVTHSDAFLRDAFRTGGFSIFHMTPYHVNPPSQQQAVSISSYDEADRAIVDLVGDIAAYRPGSKVVIFESSDEASFDASATLSLFPELRDRVNAISGDNSAGVKQLYRVLKKVADSPGLPFAVYAIIDRDSHVAAEAPKETQVLTWDVYHIENYFLEPHFISKVMAELRTHCDALDEYKVACALESCASETIDSLVEHQLRLHINSLLMTCIDLGYDRSRFTPAEGLHKAAHRILDKLEQKVSSELDVNKLREQAQRIRMDFENALRDGSWRRNFRGRDILRRFAGRHVRRIPYEAFRDLILARMVDAGFQPEGMKTIVGRILEDKNNT